MQNDGISRYIVSIGVAGLLLTKRIITKREFLAFENLLCEKYHISHRSLYRDYRLVYLR